MNNHVILCGLGELGFRTLERLRAFNEDVVVIDPRPSAEMRMRLSELKVELVQGVGRDPRALREARVLTARAVIATTGDDLKNLGIALAAREENPDVQLVMRLFNPRMSEKVQREIPHCRVLDVAALAAPVFAYAGVHDDILHILDVPGGRFLLRRWRGAAPAEARVIAVKRRARDTFEAAGAGIGFSIAARPDWDMLPMAGGAAGPEDETFGLIAADGGPRATEPSVRRRGRLARELRKRWQALKQNRLMPVMLLISALMALSMLVFQELLHLTPAQALYFVVTIMTTTGFGDISVKDAAPGMVLFVSALMVFGSLLMAVLYAFVTEIVLSIRLGAFFERQPLPQRDHFVIFGLGTVGFRIAEELQRLGFPAVAIERQENSRLVERARRMGVRVVVSQDVFGALGDTNLEDARCVLTVTDDDALNLDVALLAQERNPRGRVVVRFFDPHMASLLERTFGMQLARSPSAIAAPAFAVAASGDELIDAFDLGDEVWCAGLVRLAEGHALVGQPPAALHARAIMPLTWRPAGGDWRAFSPDTALSPGDELVVVTPHDAWLRLHALAKRPGAPHAS